MAVNPISLNNLRAPWQPGEQGTAGVRYVERMVSRAQKAGPQAMRLLQQAMRNPELPMGLRCRIAEYIVDKAWPKTVENGGISISGGIECLELRFVAPGREVSETISLPLSTDTSSLKDQAISTTYSVEEQSSHTLSHTEDGAESSESEDGE